jgi:hypothetical protein
MSQDQQKPLRLFVDPFSAWRELAFKSAEMIAAAAQAGAASARSIRVAVIEERALAPVKAASKKKHKKRARRR